jgi:hypothetical protein
MAAWQESTAPSGRENKAAAEQLEKAYAGWDDAITVINETRKKQAQAPGQARHLPALYSRPSASPRSEGQSTSAN